MIDEFITFAEISIESVRVEGRRANAFAWLNAFFVSFALVIVCASFLGRGAQTVVRITTVSVRTDTLVGTWLIYALGSVTTDLVTVYALVDV